MKISIILYLKWSGTCGGLCTKDARKKTRSKSRVCEQIQSRLLYFPYHPICYLTPSSRLCSYSQIVYLSYLPNTSYRWLRHANILEKMFLSYELTSIVNYLGSQPNYHQSVFLFMHLSSMKIFARNLIFPLQTMMLITSIILSNCVNVQVWLIFLASVNLSGDAALRRILAWMWR